MLYSGNHCIALANLYAERFGQLIPPEVAKLAASNGTHQQMMHATDCAIRNHQPIEDWSDFIAKSPDR